MNLVLFGAPGSGKGTQSALLVERLGLKHLSTGDLFRKAITEGTELGQKAQGYMDRGELVPDSVVIGMVEEKLKQESAEKGWILDGFPRTVEQAESLDKTLEQLNMTIGAAVFLSVPAEKLIRRLTGRRMSKSSGAVYHVEFRPPQVEGKCDIDGSPLIQRDDDKPEVVEQRLEAYEKSTAPLIDYYRSQGLYVEVDGDQDAEAVFKEIESAVKRAESD